jgi:putative peptide zinc metalloprotease protein
MAATPEPAPTEFTLPPLREDLQLHEGVASRDGHATWAIQDPLAQRFYEVDATLVGVLSLWDCGSSAGVDALMRARGQVAPNAAQWQTILLFLEQHGLLRPTPGKTLARVQHARREKKPWWQSLVHHYLFFKLPLAQPDAFLRRACVRVAPLFTRTALVLWVLAGLLGLHLVSRQWEGFLATYADLKNPAGIALLTVCLAFVKALHELGHGLTAARHGVRVGSMGVAFMVMVPVLYTDTTDAWRLASRRARLAIDVAGIAVELMIAVAATLAWVILPDGLPRYIAFALATTGWVLSLAVNLNPLMRFDGYYVFSDLVNLPNLQERSFAMGRWWMRRTLWGWDAQPPEACSARRRGFLVGFAIATWLYRLVLFLGIAVLVYHFFFKALGVAMFCVEIVWFIALPIVRELRAWHRERGRFGGRARWTSAAVAAAFIALWVPWSDTIHVPAVMAAEDLLPAYAPRPSRILSINARVGDAVRAGQKLMALEAPELDTALVRASERQAALRERVARTGSDTQDRAESLVLRRELQLETERIAGLTRDRERLVLRAPIDGTVVQLDQELHVGRWVDHKTELAWVARPGQRVARGYVSAEDALRLMPDRGGRFRDEGLAGYEATVRVARVAGVATRSMDLWLLTSSYGGPITTRDTRGKPEAEQAMVEIKAMGAADAHAWPLHEVRGELLLSAKPGSVATRAWQRLVRVWHRERSA